MDLNAKQAFLAWCKSQNMSVHSALSLAFVPNSTYRKVFNSRVLPPQYRLYLLTGLQELKLNADEQADYQKLRGTEKRPRIEYTDEKIASFFIETWRSTGRFPEPQYCLVISANNNPAKDDLTKKILADLMGKASGPKKESIVSVSSPGSPKESDLVAALDNFQALLRDFMVNASEEEFELFLKRRKKAVRETYGFLVPLLDERPYDAASSVRSMREFLSHQKTSGKS